MKKTTMDVRSAVIRTLSSVNNGIAWVVRIFPLAVHKPKVNKEKGFTLIELMIVIAIIGILAGIAVPLVLSYRDKAFCTAAEHDADKILSSLADYFAIPSHTRLQTPMTFAPPDYSYKNFQIPLSNKNVGTITGASVSDICITVIEVSGRCPDEYGRAGSPYWHKVGGLWVFERCMK